MSLNLCSLAATLHVSTHRALSIIDEVNGYLPRKLSYPLMEEAADALPIPFRKPVYIAAQLVKKHKLVPDRLPKPYKDLLAEVKRAPKMIYHVIYLKGVTYEGRQETVQSSSMRRVDLETRADQPL